MTPPTLHRLLWGPDPEKELTDWCIRAWETPAVGLPARVAAFLFLAAQKGDIPQGWDAICGPLTWRLDGDGALLSRGRRSQFGFDDQPSLPVDAISMEQLQLQRSTEWEQEPHGAYFLPLVIEDPQNVDRSGYVLYCDVLLLLTAMDGGETILDRLVESGVGTVPFEDRWDWRSRIHLPKDVWKCIERAFRWSEAPREGVTQIRDSLVAAFRLWIPVNLTLDDFLLERVDILLESTSDAEMVRTIRPPDSTDTDLPPQLLLREAKLQRNFLVRIGQIAEWPSEGTVVQRFPAMDLSSANRIMEQIASAFQSPSHARTGRAPDMVLLPELTIPQPEVGTVRDLVAATGCASLAGLYWRELRPAYAACGSTRARRRWFVNEAELVLPVGHEDRGPTTVRWYRVRKPVPAHIETGLAQELSSSPREVWRILSGKKWYRFVHPKWGDFTVAICADLLDAAPWRSLRGELLHLFMVAFNKDVDLYDSLTWVRAYENYVNVVAVNHGSYGGSFLWTPRRSQGRQLAQLRGGKLFLVADVDVPVMKLLAAQKSGVQEAVDAAACSWSGKNHPSSEFKSPPPGFERLALLHPQD